MTPEALCKQIDAVCAKIDDAEHLAASGKLQRFENWVPDMVKLALRWQAFDEAQTKQVEACVDGHRTRYVNGMTEARLAKERAKQAWKAGGYRARDDA